jgi:hypothetical protein
LLRRFTPRNDDSIDVPPARTTHREAIGLASPGKAGAHQGAAGAVASLEQRIAVAGIGHTRDPSILKPECRAAIALRRGLAFGDTTPAVMVVD